MSDYSSKRVPGLDLVRSVAILCVLVSHYWPLYERFPSARPFQFFGVLGVEIFFVLSGFLIGGILLRQAAETAARGRPFQLSDAPGFWVRRWFRTLPNYLLFLVIFLLYDRPWDSGHWKAWGLSLLFLQNLFTDASQGTFGVAWSLCVEEWLYLLLPLVLVVSTRVLKNEERAAFWSAGTLIAIPVVLRCFTHGIPWDLGVRHVVIYRLDAIAVGVLLAWLARYRPVVFSWVAAGPRATVAAVALSLITAFYWLAGSAWVETGATGIKWFCMHVAFFSLVSFSIAPLVAWGSRISSVPWGLGGLVYRTSLYSYSMYLAHTLFYFFTGPVLYRILASLVGEFPGMTPVVMVLCWVALFGFSALVYHGWEAPMTRMRERFSASVGRGASAR